MSDTNCPYCGAEIEINHDDDYGYEEGELYEQECPSCGKSFAYDTSISFYYRAYKADCLNGGEHVMKKVVRAPRVIGGKEEYRCKNCGHTENRRSVCSVNCGKNKTECWQCKDAK